MHAGPGRGAAAVSDEVGSGVSSGVGGAFVQTGFYWHRGVYDLARAAYVADLDADPPGPEFFVEWFRVALSRYSRLDPVARAKALADLPRDLPETPGLEEGPGFNQMYPIPAELLEDLERAIVEERRELGVLTSRSRLAREAAAVAAAAARRRRGRPLPSPPRQLANRRPRRHI